MGSLVTTRQTAATVEEEAQYLTFMLGGEMFAIGILGIKEIIEYGSLTVVPMMPAFVRGVINLRGAVVPVVDLSARFGRQNSAITRRSCVIIIEANSEDGQPQDIGLLVDNVSAVLEIPASQIEPPPNFGARIRADFISGMAKVDGKFVIVLEVDRVLSIDEMSSLAEASQSLPTDVDAT
ncbi:MULTISPECIES: chemotaxis protein CheW [Pseudomonas]|jgi:purine-binding chemotaxis protein CheW|uniref:Chemotaxis protein CheW n=9 Tax=Pseudomonas syringae group TaxID=136849 RepID=F3GEI0_PSESJ|nr:MULTISPECIES: chemotaxis protein CheW [Pseudomonas]EGH45480.1 CheW-like protein [Pseudomonas syringae pv. pisi str. 1704B]AKF53198.1 Chemotaxis signal transduction protein [Pseudomonas syringae pv. syringae HS191]ALU59056.1 chemotaxis protein CheW [Pseudomonas syringae pv. lapsa]EKG40698.1 chemotaxis protein CheW [Pseudomonas syringae pv. avellanae str. ISPaVe037]KPW84301.1 Chemotaxis protein CheW [Pseudomonas syringae pv. coryli]